MMKKPKRATLLLLFAMVVAALCPTLAFADEVGGDGWSLDDSGCLSITGAVTNPSSVDDNTPWLGHKDRILSVVAEEGSPVDNASFLFSDCSNLASVDISKLDTSNVTSMYCMFKNCAWLTSLEMGNLDTSEVTRMDGMFEFCGALTSLDLSHFDTSNVTAMDVMFQGCSGLVSLDVSSFDTSEASSMYGMFQGCSGLASLDVSSFDTSKVNFMHYMFLGCSGLESLDLSGFDVSNVSNMSRMLDGCSGLQEISAAPALFAGVAADIIAISPTWMDKAAGTIYSDAESIGTISEIATIIRKSDGAHPHSIVVNNGTADCISAEKGTTVTVTANAPGSGKVFDTWMVVRGEVTFDDAGKALATFTMPDGDVEVSAVFRDAARETFRVEYIVNGDSDWGTPEDSKIPIDGKEYN